MKRPKIKRRDIYAGVIALVGTGAVVGAVAFTALSFGAFNVSATYPHPKPVHWMLHYVFKRTVAVRSSEEPPEDLMAEGRRLLGTQHYANACAKCHGGPGLGQNPQALSMRPRPQHLASVVDQFSDSELHWILKNGVRYSAMPSWPAEDRDDEIWNVVAFLRELPELSTEEYVSRLQWPEGEDLPMMPYGERGPLIETDMPPKAPPLDEYLYASPATEWRDFAIQGHPVQRCAACHGVDGSGSATNGYAPNLTALDAPYIETALEEYAAAERESGIMQIVASNLSATQRTELAAYFANLPDKKAPKAGQPADLVPVGEEIALNGVPERAIPACTTCHQQGRSELVDGLAVPNLAGQSPVYIREQLELFAKGGRRFQALWNPMHYVGGALEEREMIALGAYFSSLEPDTALPQPTLALADVEAGQQVVINVCSKCHQASGRGSDGGDVPNISLQNETYISHQLWKFRNDIRPNSRMSETTKLLSAEELRDAAAYFGSLEPLDREETVDATLVAQGDEIVRNGIPERDVPSCLTCHAESSVRDVPIIARLHGQTFEYLDSRLEQFAGDTGDGLYGLSPMHRIASRMDDGERAAAAAWFAAQDPLPKD